MAEDYVHQHSAGSILRGAVDIYRRHFGVLFLSSLIPLSPTIALALFGVDHLIASAALDFLMGILNTVPATIVISDICVGNQPTLARAYRRAFGPLTPRVLLTVLLVFFLPLLGLLLLIVPGIIFGCWYLFAIIVVVLERTSARGALARSRQLGKGFYLRNLGVFFLAVIVFMVPLVLVASAAGAIGSLLDVSPRVLNLIGKVLSVVVAPLLSIPLVLLYYDMRVRKEAYDSMRLAEDLRH